VVGETEFLSLAKVREWLDAQNPKPLAYKKFELEPAYVAPSAEVKETQIAMWQAVKREIEVIARSKRMDKSIYRLAPLSQKHDPELLRKALDTFNGLDGELPKPHRSSA
jgi:hypothetical protein